VQLAAALKHYLQSAMSRVVKFPVPKQLFQVTLSFLVDLLFKNECDIPARIFFPTRPTYPAEFETLGLVAYLQFVCVSSGRSASMEHSAGVAVNSFIIRNFSSST